MSWSRSPLAFSDVEELFERALAAPNGIKIAQSSRSAAVVLRSRFNYYRKLNRKANADTYPRDHTLHGASAYDTLVLRIPPAGAPDEHVLYIEPRRAGSFMVEDL